MELVSPLYLNQNELNTCWNVCELIAILLEHITVVLKAQGVACKEGRPLELFLHRCVW